MLSKVDLIGKIKSMGTDRLVRDATILFILTMLANVCDYLFQVSVSRRLGPAQYGIFVSLTGLFLIVSVPSGTLQTAITKFVSSYKATNQDSKIAYLFFNAIKKMSFVGFIILLLFLLGSGCISSFLRISSSLPVIIVGVSLGFSLVMPVVWGTLQGLQKFTHLGENLFLNSFSRLMLGFFLVCMGLGVSGALGALVLAWVIAFFAALFPLRPYLFSPEHVGVDSEVNFIEVYRYSLPTLVALLCFTILRNMDVILVKHFFSPLDAGFYSAVAVVGRVFFALPATIAGVMFPKVSELHAQNSESRTLLKKCLVLSLLLLGVGALGCLLFPRFVILALFGSSYLPTEPLVRVFGVVITPLVLSGVLISYNLARHEMKFIYLLLLGTVGQAVLLVLFHDSLWQVIFILGLTGSLLFFFLQYSIFSESWRSNMIKFGRRVFLGAKRKETRA